MELGSEYNLSLEELTLVEDNIFNYLSEYKNCFYFDSGRSSLKYIVSQLVEYKKVLLPEFICESVSRCFIKSEIIYYRIKDDFTVDIDDLQKKVGNEQTVIFLMHYFGTLQPVGVLENIRFLADKSNSIIIEDTTHSIFTKKQTIGDYMICSLRKWLPIANGGVLYYNQDKKIIKEPKYQKSTDNMRYYGMILKELFLKKKIDYNREYRAIFLECENNLDCQKDIYLLSDLSKFIASCVSIEQLIKVRKKNFEQLNNKMKEIGVNSAISINLSDIPLVYLLRIKNRDKLRNYLTDKKIYCAVHWPFDNHKEDQRPLAKQNAEELISLPIDQRYDEEYIQYMTNVLYNYGGDLLY